ncbi:type II toxin-antitoxin system VapC family toxin [Paracoccus sp. IB05]|uniref:type II toxin-antitoxin system VapC family toxin n=1 Tax=Paracoccus sp. IB05 TaxID=2779367 RepID=UPI0018E763AA|nr:type II toxin-antitoxin system VapC family toxin [Paracoccus sp. IB05]MBJ2152985.1 type II toxin-antitoxin system VapC family toxin [Paracoccus sp. IB05]
MFLLDTNVISELRKAGDGRSDANVTAWLGSQDAGALFISAIAAMELDIGVRRIELRDPTQGAMLRAWFAERVQPEFQDRILPVDTSVALRCAGLHVPDPRSERDALIAATGLVHGFTVVTRNTGDFKDTGVVLLNPWVKA